MVTVMTTQTSGDIVGRTSSRDLFAATSMTGSPSAFAIDFALMLLGEPARRGPFSTSLDSQVVPTAGCPSRPC